MPRKSAENSDIRAHGLLYLEHPYVVPGGQFNEMYGWDSYFIIRGLLRNDRRDLAGGMVEDSFYEITHYGGVLNANRTYYLGRSQPPFLSSMILALYRADQAAGQPNLEWLGRAYQFAVSDYEQWTRPPHLAGDTGLSRYYDDRTIREKYDVVKRSSETKIRAGYAKNVSGFGWTNGVFLELLHEAPPDLVAWLRNQ